VSQTLYRKYRSQRFADIVGQASVVRVLQNSIVRERLNHAYLFCGPRGTGKTSIARIFAKALNCLNPQDGDACGVCDVCKDIATGNAVDVIEIDAASNRGIDDIRDLRERVAYAPLELKRKVYIIDEVHMITPQGFNALLKTLEEPPSHVIFCLCTTEANKLPITILSRCIRFDFQRLPLDALAAHLEGIAQAENFTLEPGCGLKLARLAEGSARDAISLLDQLTVFCDSNITSADIDELFQLGDPAQVRGVVDSVLAGSSHDAIAAWENMLARGVDAGTFLLQLADELKARYLEAGTLQAKTALEAIWQGLNLLKYDNFPALLVELTLIQAAAGPTASAVAPQQQSSEPQRRPVDNSPSPAQRVAQLQREQRSAPHVPVRAEAIPQRPAATPPRVEPIQVHSPRVEATPVATVTPSPVRETAVQPAAPLPVGDAELLEAYRDKVLSIRQTTWVLLREGVRAVRSDNRLTLFFEERARPAYAFANTDSNLAILRDAARQLFGQHTVIELRREGEVYEAPQQEPTAESSTTNEARPTAPETLAAGTGSAEALESSSANGAGERLATFDDALRIFGGAEAGENNEAS
jgi:DNA polymerase III subunit gamma/tau